MGLRAIDAVQRHSQYREDSPENFAPYRVMVAIAWYADDEGVAGVEGDHKKCPSINTIAERANVHRNTVMNWLPKLQEAGELVVEKHGNGRGAHLVYTILLSIDPMDLPEGKRNGTSVQAGDVPIEQGESDLLVHEIADMKRLLVQQNELLVQALVQGIGTNGTSPQTDVVHDPLDPSLDPKEGKAPPPPVEHDLVEMVNALVDVTGLDGHRFWPELSGEAREMLGGGYTAVELLEFYMPPSPGTTGNGAKAWNWYFHDWRGRKGDRPKLKDIWETISGARKGAPVVADNSRASPAPAELSEAMTIPHTGKGW